MSSNKSGFTPLLSPTEYPSQEYDLYRTQVQDDDPAVKDAREGSFFGGIINLANTVIGAGVLGLPFGYKLSGIILGNILVLILGLMGVFSVYLITISEEQYRIKHALGELSQNRGSVNYANIMEGAVGKVGIHLTDIAIGLNTFGACVAYLVIIADLFTPLLSRYVLGVEPSKAPTPSPAPTAAFGGLVDNHPLEPYLRTIVIFSVLVILIPLSSMKTMDSLKHTSTVAMTSIAYLVLIILIEGGIAISNKSWRDNDLRYFDLSDFGNLLRTVPIICLAYSCQTSIMPIWNEVKNPSRATFNKISGIAHVFCYICYALVGTFGYLIFYQNTESNLLVNWSGEDKAWLILARVGVALTVTFSFPVLMYPHLEIWERKLFPGREWSYPRHLGILLAVLVPCVSIAILVEDVGVIFGVTGSVASTQISFILPGVMALKLVPGRPLIKAGAWYMVIIGLIFMVASTYVTIADSSSSSSPTDAPTTLVPTLVPTWLPTFSPTSSPTFSPTFSPTGNPTVAPTEFPTSAPAFFGF